MKRREFIGLIGGTVVWPLGVRAQQQTLPVIGFLGSASSDVFESRLRAFRQGLSETGYIEGRNVTIEFRWADYHFDRLGLLATDLVQRQVAVIAVPGSVPGALAAKAATSTIPVVFYVGIDPVEAGLVASLNRPGGNLTGVSSLNAELGPKLLEMLHSLVPMATVIALLVNPTNPTIAEDQSRNMHAAARTLGLEVHVLHASTERDFDTAFEALARLQARALVISPDSLFTSQSEQLAALAFRHAVPTIYLYREFASAGGLASYGGSLMDAYRLAGVYTGRILKGEKPADLPVQQSTKLELIINLKTANALGLTVPPSLLARADEVIE